MNDQPVPYTDDELKVLRVIQQHRGRAQAIPRVDLAEAVSIGTRPLEEIVKHLIENHCLPIGSSTGGKDKIHGYYMIETLSDQEKAEKQIRNRLISNARRLAHLRKNTPAEVLGQIVLELSSEQPAGVSG